jgi:ubiquinone/menaquinone biosynthesis C-methylase UbiE
MGGAHFEDDREFVASAVRDVHRLGRLAGLDTRSRVLDWGCGAGRLNVGIRVALGGVADYHGVDVQRVLIDWANEHLADEHSRFTFVDLANARYNPDGARARSIPGEDGAVDVFYAYSVFSHMLAPDVAAYLGEIARLLTSSGRAMVTAFVEEGVPDCTENPPGYGPLEWSGALHCVRFDRRAFEQLVGAAGLAVDRFVYGRETDGQSLYVLRPATRR